MSDDGIRTVFFVAELVEPPSTTLTGPARDIYEHSKRRIAEWDPIPPARPEQGET